tara:strand:+ start:2631 stop:3524 length:894 start_codon:yes stop_codon:yes gene_type:complete
MNLRGLFHLGVIYIAWGSTYLAIRVAVREGAGFAPFTMSAMRVLAGSLILFALASVVRSGRIVPTLKELRVVVISGILLWLSGNGLVAVAETKVHSSYTAVIIGTTPLFVALMESIIDRRKPSFYLLFSLLIGIVGVTVLNWPMLLARNLESLWAAGLIIFACIGWGAGSIIQGRKKVGITPEASSAWQQLAGSIVLGLSALLMNEPIPAPTNEAWVAWGYLVIFGSVIAFTSFVKALRLLPTDIVMTYAYVNPVVAVFLGWLILGEPVTIYTLAGMILIVIGVMGVFRDRGRQSTE